jgi:hypothetical protein
VAYEDLLSQWDSEIVRIQRFLGLPEHELRPTTRQQSNGRPEMLIRNIDEVREAIQLRLNIPECLQANTGFKIQIP